MNCIILRLSAAKFKLYLNLYNMNCDYKPRHLPWSLLVCFICLYFSHQIEETFWFCSSYYLISLFIFIGCKLIEGLALAMTMGLLILFFLRSIKINEFTLNYLKLFINLNLSFLLLSNSFLTIFFIGSGTYTGYRSNVPCNPYIFSILLKFN